jgi:hypothetical protein
MEDIRIPGIKISGMDMGKCYFNSGGALRIDKPGSGRKILDMLNKRFGPVKPHRICCHHDPRLPHGAALINNCAGCYRRSRSTAVCRRTIAFPASAALLHPDPEPRIVPTFLRCHGAFYVLRHNQKPHAQHGSGAYSFKWVIDALFKA